MRTVLFVCEGNRFRSQIAEGFFNAWAPPGWRGVSGGTNPKASVHPAAVAMMLEVGIDISHHRPKPIDPGEADRAERVIAMCSPEACPASVLHKVEHWAIPDPSEVPEERGVELRDMIAERVRALLREIGEGKR